jgi:hypothetical protein
MMALDVGTRRFRSLRLGETQLLARTCPAACSFLPDKPSVRHLLEQSDVRFGSTGEQLVVWGASAEKLAKQCAVKAEHLLARNPLRKEKRTIMEPLNHMLAALLPAAAHPGEICCIGSLSDDLHADWLEAAVVSRGYRPLLCSAGLALVLAELVQEQLTGIALVFGGSRCEAVLAQEGVEIARCELPHGGEAIDQSIAISEDRYWWSMSGFRELETDSITEWKESLTTSVLEPAIPRGERLLAGTHQLAAELCGMCETTFPQHGLPDDLAVIAGGGSARIPGFIDLLNQHLLESSLPIDHQKTRLATAEYTIARGLLIHAELAQRGERQSSAA